MESIGLTSVGSFALRSLNVISFQPTGVAGVVSVELLLGFFARNKHVLGIEDNNIVATVGLGECGHGLTNMAEEAYMQGRRSAYVAHEGSSNVGGQATPNSFPSIHNMPYTSISQMRSMSGIRMIFVRCALRTFPTACAFLY